MTSGSVRRYRRVALIALATSVATIMTAAASSAASPAAASSAASASNASDVRLYVGPAEMQISTSSGPSGTKITVTPITKFQGLERLDIRDAFVGAGIISARAYYAMSPMVTADEIRAWMQAPEGAIVVAEDDWPTEEGEGFSAITKDGDWSITLTIRGDAKPGDYIVYACLVNNETEPTEYDPFRGIPFTVTEPQ